jgi:hypothetical protein
MGWPPSPERLMTWWISSSQTDSRIYFYSCDSVLKNLPKELPGSPLSAKNSQSLLKKQVHIFKANINFLLTTDKRAFIFLRFFEPVKKCSGGMVQLRPLKPSTDNRCV